MNKNKNRTTEEKAEEFVMKISLRAVRVATDKVNYQILKMLPTNYSQISEKINLSKTSIYRHLRELERCKLIKWDKAIGNSTTGFMYSTELTNALMNYIDKLEVHVTESVLQQLRE